MKEYATDKIRNIAMVSHSGAGKTILADAFLFEKDVINRMGSVTEGNTVSDFDEEEQRRELSLSTSIIPIEHKDHKINLLDTPGYSDFIGEVLSALRVVEGALVIVDAVAGAEVGTETAWNICDELKLPRLVLINRMKRETANYEQALTSVQNLTDTRLIKVQLPWGEKENYQGLVDLVKMKAYPAGGGAAVEIPEELAEAAQEAHSELVEAAAESDDVLMEKYFESGELSPEEISTGLKNVVKQGLFIPVFVADSQTKTGISQLLDAFIDLIPSPAESAPEKAEGPGGEIELTASDTGPLAAYVWKTMADPFVGKITFFKVKSGILASDTRVWNANKEEEERLANLSVMRGKEQINVPNMHAGDIGVALKLSETVTGDTLSDKGNAIKVAVGEFPSALHRVAVTPKTQADASKMGQTLTRICDEDMTLSWFNEPSTRQTILQGMGGQHIDVVIRKAEGKFQVGLDIEPPRVPYKETITKKGDAQHRHKKQSGGSGQFGEVFLRIEPLPDDDFEFVNEVVGGSVSQNYMTAIEKGIKSVMQTGVVAGFPVHNVRAAVYDGKEHPVDSKPVAFEIAGREAFKKAIMTAGPVLLEPIMNVRITVPEDNMGDVLGDLNTRRARVQGMDTDRGRSVVNAHVPLAELLSYTTELRSMTGGRGVFTMEEDHYERVPTHLQADIVAAKEKVEEEE
ncbi:MAG: elongation factor G [Chloroflexi bacterium]|jgi:elongation factor G|nr:elongation factor G [Chloroflexota bacterium]MBT3670938.1 elongation factor G [Chloroflexota bacterium]MBT4306348.1 elongation factor G [Chloroflexota bacterium]MBT4532771.1 elongation factor G [Chloroflexota bacterium]MBT4683019.1 elongation factor G [Chloroflexota bacterium]